MSDMHFVYMVRCTDGTLYTGYTSDLNRREKVHNSGRGAKYTANRLPVSLVYSEQCESLGKALRREYEVKRLSRAQKELLIRLKPGTRAGATGGARVRQRPRRALPAQLASTGASHNRLATTSRDRQTGHRP
jgi:putative endonuclease